MALDQREQPRCLESGVKAFSRYETADQAVVGAGQAVEGAGSPPDEVLARFDLVSRMLPKRSLVPKCM